MNDRHRTIVVIATGLVLVVIAATATRLLNADTGGWFNYSPNEGMLMSGTADKSRAWGSALIWLVAIAGWTVIALVLFNRRDDE